VLESMIVGSVVHRRYIEGLELQYKQGSIQSSEGKGPRVLYCT